MSKKYKPIIKEGTHLASSKKTDGTYRGALLDNDTNKVVGQAEWEEVEEDDDWEDQYEYYDNREKVGFSEENQEIGILDDVLDTLLEIGAPYIEQFVTDKIIPGVNKTMSRIAEKSAPGILNIRNLISSKTKSGKLFAKKDEE
jgi:hypothetical protein